MDLKWSISKSDARELWRFVDSYRRTEFVRLRFYRCVRGNHKQPGIQRFWKALVLAFLTTQQRSSPGSPVQRFLRERPFPLSYKRCNAAKNVERYAQRQLKRYGGIRRSTTIASQLDEAMDFLRAGRRSEVRDIVGGLERHRGFGPEREVARYLSMTFNGLGPKQSRNLLQAMGLTRYEIPLDSRITKWLNEYGFPVRLSAKALADEPYYEFVMDGVRKLCSAANVYPCIFDAAVFSSFDAEPWEEEALV